MSTVRATILPLILLGILFASGCETSESKKPASVPAQANAPTIIPASSNSAQQQPKIQEQLAPKSSADPVDALIAKAEKQLAEGQAN